MRSFSARDALSGIYGIAGANPGPDGDLRDPVAVARSLCAGGATCVQLRLKGWSSRELISCARLVREVCRQAGVAFVVNDRADIALLVEADGVHLGQDDLSVSQAREILGQGPWVGVSTHDLAHVRQALVDGADYLGFGPVFDSPTKPGVRAPRGLAVLPQVVQCAGQVPVVAIGGMVSPQAVAETRAAGVTGVAVLSAVSGAVDMQLATATLVAAYAEGGP